MRENVWAGMATLTERVEGRAYACESLIRFVDRLTVCSGDMTNDCIKFASCPQVPDGGVFICVDDDLIYPPGFVDDLLEALDRHPNAIVGFHGWMVTPEATRGICYPALGTVEAEQKVDVVATCACAWNVDVLRISPEECPALGADIWLMLKAERLGVERYVIPHRGDYFGYTPPQRTIWDETVMQTGSRLDSSKVVAHGCQELVRMRSVISR